MAFLDELGKTLADKGKEAAQRAKEMAEVLQLKGQVAQENGKVKELYGAIGALYFKKHRDEPEDEYQLFFPEIEKSLTCIAQLEAKVRELEGSRCCASCGAVLRREDIFCSKCGAPVEDEPEGEETPASEETQAAAGEPEALEEDGLTPVEDGSVDGDIFVDEDEG